MSLKLGRYDNYTTRDEVYLFTLRDYANYLLDRFGGRFINREAANAHAGYLLEFVNYEEAFSYLNAIKTDVTTDDRLSFYKLPPTSGNEFTVYATAATYTNVVYIGLMEYKEVLDQFIKPVFTITFDKNTGTGSDYTITAPEGYIVTMPAADTYTAPEGKEFSVWSSTTDAATGSDIYTPGTKYEMTNQNITLYAVWVETSTTDASASTVSE